MYGYDRTRFGELDNFQVATTRMIETMHGHLSGNSPVMTLDNVRAVCEIVSGYTNHLRGKSKRSQGKVVLPHDLPLIYKFEIDPDDPPSRVPTKLKHDPNDPLLDLSEVALEIRQNARDRSNFSKHADKHAGELRSYDADCGLDMLMFEMLKDYETLHCALIEHGLLDCTNEKLYPIQAGLLESLSQYKYIYNPFYAATLRQEFSKLAYLFSGTDPFGRNIECHVPAAVAVCAIAQATYHDVTSKVKAEKIRELGIWPVNINTNAFVTHDHNHAPDNNLEL